MSLRSSLAGNLSRQADAGQGRAGDDAARIDGQIDVWLGELEGYDLQEMESLSSSIWLAACAEWCQLLSSKLDSKLDSKLES